MNEVYDAKKAGWEIFYGPVLTALQNSSAQLPITQSILSKRTGATGEMIRQIANEALHERIVLVGSSRGYYIAKTKPEIRAQIDQLENRALALRTRISTTMDIYNDVPDGPQVTYENI